MLAEVGEPEPSGLRPRSQRARVTRASTFDAGRRSDQPETGGKVGQWGVSQLSTMCRGSTEAAVPSETWSKAWVVDCRSVGSGQAVLKYLAPYIFRVALSNNRIVGVANDQVTFR